jgi:hypothetical protein
MLFNPDGRSATQLREKLAADPGPMRMFQTEALYHAQVEWTCLLLDVVDEVTDAAAAERVTDAIYDRLAGDAAGDAAARIRETQREYARIVRGDR